MVNGFAKFKERFQGFENQYVIIGGTACDLIMENEELPFRATKDIDIVLIVESITAEFGRQFERELPIFCANFPIRTSNLPSRFSLLSTFIVSESVLNYETILDTV